MRAQVRHGTSARYHRQTLKICWLLNALISARITSRPLSANSSDPEISTRLNIRALRVSLKPELAAKLLGFPKPAHHLGGGLRAFQWYHATSIEAVVVGPVGLKTREDCLSDVFRLSGQACLGGTFKRFGKCLRRADTKANCVALSLWPCHLTIPPLTVCQTVPQVSSI